MSVWGQMKIHEIQGYIQTTYLIEYPDKLLLFDSGCSCDVDLIIETITQKLHRKVGDLKIVFIGHMHPDHAGGAKKLKLETGCFIASSQELNQWYSGFQGFLTHKIDIFLAQFLAFKNKIPFKKVQFQRKIQIDFIVGEGDALPYFPDWKVIKTPGHTCCDFSLVHSRTQSAYVSDNLIKRGQSYVAPYPMALPQRYKQTLSRYNELGIKRFLLAHHGVCEISKEQIEHIISKISNRPRLHRNSLFKIIFSNWKKRTVKTQTT